MPNFAAVTPKYMKYHPHTFAMRKKIMLPVFPFTLFLLLLTSCSPTRTMLRIDVQNPSDEARTEEMAEVDARLLGAVHGKAFRLLDPSGREVPYQFTSDGKFIFPVTLLPSSSARFHVVGGKPSPVDTLVVGRQYKERDDDFAWENDRSGYRAYGPALQARGERGFGYDIFTKSVSHPVLEHRYALACNPQSLQQIREWRTNGLKVQADSLERAISYHVDHGDGMDVYPVGPTLGAGAAALVDGEGRWVYPWCYDTYEVTDCGPLRFTFRLKFKPQVIGADTAVVETRTISLDRGSYLNRTTVHYDGLTSSRKLVAGIAVHEQNPEGYAVDEDDRYVAYADSTDDAHADHGVIYVGLVSPESDRLGFMPYDEAERPQHAHALGHVAASATYTPGSDFTYYWGSGWSKGGMNDMQSWQAWLAHYSRALRHPLRVTVK